MNEEQKNKLPKWAQSEFERIQRERDAAVLQLNEFTDNQTMSPVMVEENPCTGESKGPTPKRLYIQSLRVTFRLDDRTEIDVRLDRDEKRLHVMTNFGKLLISPSTSNVIHISTEKF